MDFKKYKEYKEKDACFLTEENGCFFYNEKRFNDITGERLSDCKTSITVEYLESKKNELDILSENIAELIADLKELKNNIDKIENE